MFASFDPVALDHACTDACNAAPVIENSALGDSKEPGDHFHSIHPTTDWFETLRHAQKLGVGTMDYELVKIR